MPTKIIEHAGKHWRYHAYGNGRPKLLVLPGSLGANDGIAALINETLPDFRIIVVEYSPVRTVEEFLGALDQIVTQEGTEPLAVFGGSFGGLIAQCWARHTSHRITHLILSGTAPPDRSRIKSNRRLLPLMQWIPEFVIHGFLRLALRAILPGKNASGRWKKQYEMLIANLTREDLASRYHVAIDLDTNYRYKPGDLDPEIHVLLLHGERDWVASKMVQEQMQRLYPNAIRYVFTGGGHSTMITHNAEWAEIVSRFLHDASRS